LNPTQVEPKTAMAKKKTQHLCYTKQLTGFKPTAD